MWETNFKVVAKGAPATFLSNNDHGESVRRVEQATPWVRALDVLHTLCPLGDLVLVGVSQDGRTTPAEKLLDGRQAPLPQALLALRNHPLSASELILVATFSREALEFVVEVVVEPKGQDKATAFSIGLMGTQIETRPFPKENARSYAIRTQSTLPGLAEGSKGYLAFEHLVMELAKHLKGMAEEVRLSFGDICLKLISPNEERIGLFRHLRFADGMSTEPALFDARASKSPYQRPAYRFAYDAFQDLRSYIWLDTMLAEQIAWPRTYLHVLTTQGMRLGLEQTLLEDLEAHLPAKALAFGTAGELIVSQRIPQVWPA